ncbi:TIGR01620 family protein [Vibrio sp. S17_S38]|uniref:YcjF family protein n=1 Tax=Vibrio sp. S17_S38 TaxID=2720229 RepID=UPI0016815D84|nr:TIGR01620 family protein [Vibrio sp. S17_S38]MBD1574006.1 TIGR01620 family protein [Vibrio sp. S17_S38]
MSDYKSRKVFSSDKFDSYDGELDPNASTIDSESIAVTQPTKSTPKPTKTLLRGQQELQKIVNEVEGAENLTAKVNFTEQTQFTPMTLSEQSAIVQGQALEAQMVEVIHPKGKRPLLWSIGCLSFAGLLGWQCVNNIVTAYQTNNWLSLGWSALIAGAASFGVVVIGRELWKLRRLRNQLSNQEKAMDIIYANSVNSSKINTKQASYGKAYPFCELIAKDAGITLENVGYDRWKKSVTANHNDADVIELYDSMVVSLQDQQAKKLVANYSCEAAVLVAISPLAIADMVLIAWRNFKLINELGKVYGVELGYFSRLRLVKLVFINMAAAGASELVVDASMHALSIDIAGKLSARAAQGIGVGLLTARLGIKAMALLRPLPWQKDKAVHLSEIRKQIVLRVIGKKT